MLWYWKQRSRLAFIRPYLFKYRFVAFQISFQQVKNTWGASDKGIFCLLLHFSLISLTYEKLKGMKIIIFWLKQSYWVPRNASHTNNSVCDYAIVFFFLNLVSRSCMNTKVEIYFRFLFRISSLTKCLRLIQW